MDILSIVLGASTALGAGGTVGYLRQVRKQELKGDRKDEIEKRIGVALAPVQADISGLHGKIDHMREHNNAQLRAALYEALEPVKDAIATLNTKVEPMWKALEAQAIAAAQVLHQPDPQRHMIDALLEKFIAHALTPDEETELRGYLLKIRNWEPGRDVGFPVHPGEPTAAAIMLSTMDLQQIRRKRERG